MEIKLNNIIDCTDYSTNEVNYKIKELIFNGFKHIVLKNSGSKKGLLEGLKGEVKIEIIGDVGSEFANNINGPKIIVNGNIDSNSAQNLREGKLTVFGSCGDMFGTNACSGEFYILENCGKNSFLDLSEDSKVVIGGIAGSDFLENKGSGRAVILNLQGGNIFLAENWIQETVKTIIYLRGDKNKIKIMIKNISLADSSDADEDIYLPLISEFARLFNYSLSKIKSKPIYLLQAGKK